MVIQKQQDGGFFSIRGLGYVSPFFVPARTQGEKEFCNGRLQYTITIFSLWPIDDENMFGTETPRD